MFKNRRQAGVLLAEKIIALEIENPYVIAIPRGGVEVAAPVAVRLEAPLNVILPRKIGAPYNPEYAVGAVAPDGTVTYDEIALGYLGLSRHDLEPVIAKEKREIKNRLALYSPWGVLPDLTNNTVILVDDGIATGQTVKAALSSLQKKTQNPVILTVPVLPHDAVETFVQLAGKLVYLDAPRFFQAVSQFYENFSDLPHGEITAILDQVNRNISVIRQPQP